jgi:hypothetical protein
MYHSIWKCLGKTKPKIKKKVWQAKNKGENDPQDVMGLVSDNMYDDGDPWKTSQND